MSLPCQIPPPKAHAFSLVSVVGPRHVPLWQTAPVSQGRRVMGGRKQPLPSHCGFLMVLSSSIVCLIEMSNGDVWGQRR